MTRHLTICILSLSADLLCAVLAVTAVVRLCGYPVSWMPVSVLLLILATVCGALAALWTRCSFSRRHTAIAYALLVPFLIHWALLWASLTPVIATAGSWLCFWALLWNNDRRSR